MLNKILCMILLGLFAGLAPAEAQPAPAAPSRVKGQIIAARVEGGVTAVSKVDGSTRALHDGDQFSDQTQVVTAEGATVILVFSNGATVDLAGNSTLDIEKFEQDPFASDLKVSDMKAEPGTSVTRLNLAKGELVGKVAHLNVDKGSEFTVNTPVGAAGIRGTTFRIVFRPLPNGKARIIVETSAGRVVFTGITSGPVSIPAGEKVVATYDYTAPSPGNPGSTAQSGPVTIVTTNLTSTEEAQIQSYVQNIQTAVQDTIFQASGKGNVGRERGRHRGRHC